MTNGTRPYKSAYGHDMSCPYGIDHTLFDDQTTWTSWQHVLQCCSHHIAR